MVTLSFLRYLVLILCVCFIYLEQTFWEETLSRKGHIGSVLDSLRQDLRDMDHDAFVILVIEDLDRLIDDLDNFSLIAQTCLEDLRTLIFDLFYM